MFKHKCILFLKHSASTLSQLIAEPGPFFYTMGDTIDDAGIVDFVSDLLDKEVQAELHRLSALTGEKNKGQRPGNAKGSKCTFCAYRCFRDRTRLIAHIRSYHTKDRLYTANERCQSQWTLLLAIFNQRQSLAALQSPPDHKHLLSTSAELLKKWNPVDAVSIVYLRKSNQFELVLCLCLLLAQSVPHELLAQIELLALPSICQVRWSCSLTQS